MCTFFRDTTGNSLIMGWKAVMASRGESDHSDMVKSFQKSVEANSDTLDGCPGKLELAKVSMETSILAMATAFGEEADDDQYQAVCDAGNEWLQAIGYTGSEGKFDC